MGVCTISIKVLTKKIVAFALTNGVVNCDIVSWIYGDRLSGGIGTAVGIRARNSVGACIADCYGWIRTCVVPSVRTCAHGGERDVVSLAEAAIAGDDHGGEGVDRQCERNDTVATLGGCQRMSINTCCCEILTVKAVALPLTDTLCDRGIVSGIDRQSHRNNTVAIVHRL